MKNSRLTLAHTAVNEITSRLSVPCWQPPCDSTESKAVLVNISVCPGRAGVHWGLWGPLLHFLGTKGQPFGTPSQQAMQEMAFNPGAIPTRRFFPQPYSLSATSHQHHSVRVLQNMNKVHVPDSKVLSGLFGQNQEPVGSHNCCPSGHSLTTAECLQGLVYPLSLGCSFSSKD